MRQAFTPPSVDTDKHEDRPPAGPEGGRPSEPLSPREGTPPPKAEDSWLKPAAEEIQRVVSRGQLVNRLNFMNFVDEPILLVFSHRRYDHVTLAPAHPLPCLGEELECRWAEGAEPASLARSYRLVCALVPRGQGFLRFEPQRIEMHPQAVRLWLPEAAQEIRHRKAERHPCRGIAARLIQNSAMFSGSLLDFNARSFRVELRAEPPQSFDWIDPALPVIVVFSSGEQAAFTGECRIVRFSPGASRRGYVLEPLHREIRRFRRTEFRSRRHCLTPSPNMICRHPLTGRRVELKLVDLSGSGFSVEEEEASAVLLTGLILEGVELHFADGSRITVSAQVVFRRPADPENPGGPTRCGLALIDVRPEDHVKLLATLHQAEDGKAYVCNDIDLFELWDFFFDTGFIYPKKYGAIHAKKKEIQDRTARLYTRCPDIARHFIYQENGTIMGHLAMIRLWEESWLINHHAARTSARNKAGLIVLDQAGRFIYDAHRLCRLHLDHALTFYRPENKFPSRIFGGLTRHIGDPKGSWIDEFAYIGPAAGRAPGDERLPPGWSLDPAAAADIVELEQWYEASSGGLLLHALDMAPHNWQADTLGREYEKHGFRRARRFFALRHGEELKAVLVATVSDLGFNLSDLTNSTYVFLLAPSGLTAAVLSAALARVHRAVDYPEAPALIAPLAHVREAGIPFDKTYLLWGLKTAGFSDRYFRFLDRIMRRI
jgi:hypothetical protein